jgi:hypothetical protein
MSIVSQIRKNRKTKSEPSKIYNNPTADGLYRICLNDACQTMFQIDDDLSRAGLCWHCYLKVLRSGHCLGPHLTHPPYKYFPDTVVKTQPTVVITKKKPGKGSQFGGGICECGAEFERKTNRQKRCDTCQKNARSKQVRDAVKKHNDSTAD